MLGKKSNPTENLAQVLLDSMSEALSAYRIKSPYDKTFFCTVLGVNQKFVDSVPNSDKTDLISKYGIPETVDEGESNYYTVKINGAYYVKQSPYSFKLYENVNIRVPNGSWDNLYIEGNIPDSYTFELPELFVSPTEPATTETIIVKEGDYWIKINNNNDKNIEAFYRYENTGTEESHFYQWVTQYNVEEPGQRRIFYRDTQPTAGMKKGDIWLKYVARYNNNDINIVNIYQYTGSVWEKKGNYNNVGVALNNNNILLCDYTNPIIDTTDCEYCVSFGTNTVLDDTKSTIIGGATGISQTKAFHTTGSIIWGNSIYVGASSAGDTVDESMIVGQALRSKGEVKYSFVGGTINDLNNSYGSIIVGSSNKIGTYNSYYSGKTGGIKNSIICGEQNSVCSLNDGIVCGHGNSVNPEYDYDDQTKTLHGLIMGGKHGVCTSSDELLILGNGSGTLNNALMLDRHGDLYIQGTLHQNSADYAETYEWLDGNPQAEDRTGLFVTLVGDKIILADSGSDYILGVVSATPTVCGDTYNSYWHGKFERDVFGRILKDKNGDMIVSEKYDPNRKYIPQSQRPEKSAIGTHGKLVVVDDGTCKVNGYCKPSKNGIGTASTDKTDYRVIERKDKTHVRIVIK